MNRDPKLLLGQNPFERKFSLKMAVYLAHSSENVLFLLQTEKKTRATEYSSFLGERPFSCKSLKSFSVG